VVHVIVRGPLAMGHMETDVGRGVSGINGSGHVVKILMHNTVAIRHDMA